MTKRSTLLVVGDFACTTGFGTVNEALLSRLDPDRWNVHVLGINATGDPHPLQSRFKIYPAALHGADIFGVGRVGPVAQAVQPDVIFIHQDSWNLPGYVEAIKEALGPKMPPIIGWCPVDAPNQWVAGRLTGDVDLLCAPTQFGLDELTKGGYRGRLETLTYGVDRTLFTPGDKIAARKALGMPAEWLDDVIFGRADRNAPRKRYDLTIQHFAQWWHGAGKPQNVRMLFHCSTTDPAGWDIDQLCSWYGLDRGRVVFTQENLMPGVLWPRQKLPLVYQAWDVHVSSTQGEGYGLVSMESAACGIAQLLPDYSALGELFRFDGLTAACFLPIATTLATPNGINTFGGLVDGHALEWAFGHLYADAGARKQYADLALRAASRPMFDWDTIAERFQTFLTEVIDGH